ncbi:hypothetical protein LIER_40180 [Lithospermum erythrorhizon]|uniref:Uncharacterized protein n=1 Tax=Lithospermum erythrorhizon TaxID=34254 RepID=A0AAV3QQK2_LITER
MEVTKQIWQPILKSIVVRDEAPKSLDKNSNGRRKYEEAEEGMIEALISSSNGLDLASFGDEEEMENVEPLIRGAKLDYHKRKLGFNNAYANVGDQWIGDKKDLSDSAVDHFKSLLATDASCTSQNDLFYCIPKLITAEDNLRLMRNPFEEEIKERHVKATCNFLKHYEKVSGQNIGREKNCFIVEKGASQTRANMIAKITGFTKGKLPLKYLGINVFKGAKSIFLFEDMISKIREKVND